MKTSTSVVTMKQRNFILIFLFLFMAGGCIARRGRARDSRTDSLFKTKPSSTERQGKLFSLFNIVQFKNDGCDSTATLPSGSNKRQGTCFTASECRDKAGTASGGCAAGFGVCCLFLITSDTRDVNQNCTYIQNPDFPTPYTATSNVQYTISKSSPDVCTLRLDFETFTIKDTENVGDFEVSTTVAPSIALCKDQFTIETGTGLTYPTICGTNTGEHIFVDIGATASDTATLALSFEGSSSIRTWDIKVTQYACGDQNAPPEGCFQYHTGNTGRLKTFNFDANNGNHLPNQDYSICIRQENGMCCVEYQVCADSTNSFQLSGLSDTGDSQTDTVCIVASEDYVGITNSASVCEQGLNTVNYKSIYCGIFLNDVVAQMMNVPICSCIPPFRVDIWANNLDDLMGAMNDPSRGVCLDYRFGEAPRAYIVKSDPGLHEKEVLDYVSEHAAPYKQLVGGIEFVEAIPKSPAGKILRKNLLAKYKKELATSSGSQQ